MLTRENSEKFEDVAIPSENYLFRMLYHCTIGVLQKDGERKKKISQHEKLEKIEKL